METDRQNQAHRKIRVFIGVTILLSSAVLLVFRLGHYALWEDEAAAALYGIGVWRTGDTSASIGDNIVDYGGGRSLRGLRERYKPPLTSYMAAVPVGLTGARGSFAPRLPFALCGLTSVALMLYWASKENVSTLTWSLLSLAILGNVSFFLFCRQCAYYGATIVLCALITYNYIYWKGQFKSVVTFSVLSVGLFAASYTNYFALYMCLAIDFAIWGRRRLPLTRGQFAWILALQAIPCALIFWTWYPIDRTADVIRADARLGGRLATVWWSSQDLARSGSWLQDRLTLVWWNLRDICRCEFGSASLLLISPVVGALAGNVWLIRGAIAIVVYAAAVALVSMQSLASPGLAEVRFLVPLIPLCMVMGVLTLEAISRQLGQRLKWLVLPLGLLIFGTSLLPGGRSTADGDWSMPIAFLRELIWPPDDPYTVTANWINENIPAGKSVWVIPEYLTCSLLYHAPDVIYAWQLPYPPRIDLAGLAPIHFRGQVPPDYIVAFGLLDDSVLELTKWRPKEPYDRVATLDVFFDNEYRPELFWRSFRRTKKFDKKKEAIYIFARRRTFESKTP